MSTTGFGVASSLGSQALDSPVSYVSPGQLSNDNSYETGAGFADAGAEIQRRPTSVSERKQIPKFDMNLKDLFSDIELQGRPQSFFPQVGPRLGSSQQQQPQRQEPAPFMGSSYAIPSTPDTSAGTAPSPLQYQRQLNLAAQQRQQQQPQASYNYQPLSQTISQQPPDLSFDTLDFLDTFPNAESGANGNGMSANSNDNNNSNFWPSGDLDFGFGTGGMGGWEDGGSMEGVGAGGGGPDLFDGFFFGGGGGGSGGNGGYGNQM